MPEHAAGNFCDLSLYFVEALQKLAVALLARQNCIDIRVGISNRRVNNFQGKQVR
jgi:hypothetical protein